MYDNVPPQPPIARDFIDIFLIIAIIISALATYVQGKDLYNDWVEYRDRKPRSP